MRHTWGLHMASKTSAKMTEQDWENLRLQLKTLVDVYCDVNNDIFAIKQLMKKLVKYVKESKDLEGRKRTLPKKETI